MAKKRRKANLGLQIDRKPEIGVRSAVIASYEMPRFFYKTVDKKSAVRRMQTLGLMIWYSVKKGRTGRTKRTPMKVDELVAKWHVMIVGLAIAHDKDESDRYEAAVEDCLTPILAAPIKQVREFYPKLLKSLKDDPKVPFLVWRSYEIWIDQVLSKAPDEDIKHLKTDLAKEIADLVEQDVKDQIPQALVRALQWRSPETLEKVKTVVEREKAAGRPVRLRGRESCLFVEAGGDEHEPEVCVQI